MTIITYNVISTIIEIFRGYTGTIKKVLYLEMLSSLFLRIWYSRRVESNTELQNSRMCLVNVK